MLSRRAFVGRLAAGAAVAGAVTTIGSRAQARPTTTTAETAAPAAPADPWASTVTADAALPPSEGAPPWELLAPLSAGAALGHDWRLSALSAVQAGSCVATLTHASGRTHRVHLCRNAGTPAGLVHTAQVDLLVMNGGSGELPTDEGLAQAVATVAHAVARNESAARVAQVGLLAHAERVERFGASAQLR
jgi:hypothetical protein